MLSEGDKAPDFELVSDSGSIVKLSSLRGRTVVLYFYPRDDTPGCTTEACSFRDSWAAVEAAGAAVFGISPDSAGSHVKFKAKYALPFTLLADEEKVALKAFGAFGKKLMYGKEVEGVIRSTFIVGPDGVIRKVFPKVKPEGHAAEVLGALKLMGAG
ncbi:MAG TPA: peroxiredoxin [Rectinemataceae bacterium]|nr:peroxiredoxin [Rectinemataceae bacterium]